MCLPVLIGRAVSAGREAEVRCAKHECPLGAEVSGLPLGKNRNGGRSTRDKVSNVSVEPVPFGLNCTSNDLASTCSRAMMSTTRLAVCENVSVHWGWHW